MDINNKNHVHWACRRGMRELDIAFMPFFETDYDELSDEDKQLFVRLLECDDPQLYNWLMNQATPEDEGLHKMIKMIQKRNAERSSLA